MSDMIIQPDPAPNRDRSAIVPLDCDEVRDLIPAVALHASETGPALLVRQHCATCPACASELEASERVTQFLPFSAAPLAPSPSAKLKLMQRIAEPTFAGIDSPIIDAPSQKRRSGVVDSPPANDFFGWTRDLVSSRSIRMAAAPLAFALVFVSLYGFGAFDSGSGSTQLESDVQLTGSTVNDTLESAVAQEVTFLSAGTSGATASQPSSVASTLTTSSFMARSSRLATQTEPMRSIVPTFAECEIAHAEGNSWKIQVYGVSLPNTNGPANVYLVSKTGELVNVGDVTLDDAGNGVITVVVDGSLSEYSTLQIGPGTDNPVTDATQFVSFKFDLSERSSLGLGKAG